jgi:hypothetical protein
LDNFVPQRYFVVLCKKFLWLIGKSIDFLIFEYFVLMSAGFPTELYFPAPNIDGGQGRVRFQRPLKRVQRHHPREELRG